MWKLNKENITIENQYKQYCEVLNKILKSAKDMYEKNIINRNLQDSKKLWQYINKKLGRKVKTENKIDSLYLNDKIVSTTGDIADALINH